ncbi:unnamed protein product, partial [Prorocentrum cordatum]
KAAVQPPVAGDGRSRAMSTRGAPWGSDGGSRALAWQRPWCCGAAVLAVVWTLLHLLILQRRASSPAAAYWAVTATLAALAGALACCQRQRRRRGRVAKAGKTAAVVLHPPPHQPKVIVGASAKQVFDVQWSINGRDLSASKFNRPAGNGTSGRFLRADVDLVSDRFQLVEAEDRPGHFALQQLDGRGVLKSQLTTYGQVRAISMDMLLYMGDGEYGTLILLNQEGEYGQTRKFPILMADPPSEIIKGMVGAAAGQQVASFAKDSMVDPFRRDSPRNASSSSAVVSMNRMSSEKFHRMSSDSSSWLCAAQVRFKNEVSQKLGKDFTLLCHESKAELWWTESDFAEFLQVRVEIGKAYRAAAKNMGLNLLE